MQLEAIAPQDIGVDDALCCCISNNGDFVLFSQLLENDKIRRDQIATHSKEHIRSRLVPFQINGFVAAYHERIIVTPYNHCAYDSVVQDTFLAVSNRDPEVESYLKQLLSMGCNSAKTKAIPCFVGESGDNGKSSLVSLTVNTFGEENAKVSVMSYYKSLSTILPVSVSRY